MSTDLRSARQAKQATQAFWDANPCGTGASWDHAQRTRFRYTDPYLPELFDSGLFSDCRVLEVGCGQGLDALEIAKRCREYVGIDLSPVSVRTARGQVSARMPPGSTPAFLVADAERLPFATAAFDRVYSLGVLHHTPDLRSALSEIHRVLRPGQRLILMVYRSFTPLWVLVRSVRLLGRLPGARARLRTFAQRSVDRGRTTQDSLIGTAMLELVDSPIIATYTLSDLRAVAAPHFRVLHAECHRTGFDQLQRVLPPRWRGGLLERIVAGVDTRLRRWLGFYLLAHMQRVP